MSNKAQSSHPIGHCSQNILEKFKLAVPAFDYNSSSRKLCMIIGQLSIQTKTCYPVVQNPEAYKVILKL